MVVPEIQVPWACLLGGRGMRCGGGAVGARRPPPLGGGDEDWMAAGEGAAVKARATARASAAPVADTVRRAAARRACKPLGIGGFSRRLRRGTPGARKIAWSASAARAGPGQ